MFGKSFHSLHPQVKPLIPLMVEPPSANNFVNRISKRICVD